MSTDTKRRLLLKGSLAAGTVGVAMGAGLLSPQQVMAAWPEGAFKAKQIPEALKELFGSDVLTDSAEIDVKAPEIAENGAVVPVTVTTTIAGAESISLLAPENPVPLLATFILGEGAEGYASTRIKMGKTGAVVAVVKAGDKLFSAQKEVKVTIGGCGG
jgi:sulfur-oxidizing protein SoxY